MNRNYKRLGIYAIYLISIFIAFFISINFTFKSVNDSVSSLVSYLVQGGYTYTVHYKDNDYYKDTTYQDGLSRDAVIPGKLIESIDINFDYHIHYSDTLVGDVVYTVESKLVVEDNLNKTITIEDTKTDNYKTKDFDLIVNTSIDYDYYKGLYNEYINTMGEAFKGKAYVYVELKVLNEIDYHSIDTKDSNTITAVIPLSEEKIQITKSTNIENNKKTLESYVDNKMLSNFYTITSVFMWIVSILLVFSFTLYYAKDEAQTSTFQKKLAKILREYDSIIVEVKRLPYLESYKVIETITFNELLDAQSALEMPINYKMEKGVAKFVIVKDDLAYVYYLKENKKV